MLITKNAVAKLTSFFLEHTRGSHVHLFNCTVRFEGMHYNHSTAQCSEFTMYQKICHEVRINMPSVGEWKGNKDSAQLCPKTKKPPCAHHTVKSRIKIAICKCVS